MSVKSNIHSHDRNQINKMRFQVGIYKILQIRDVERDKATMSVS